MLIKLGDFLTHELNNDLIKLITDNLLEVSEKTFKCEQMSHYAVSIHYNTYMDLFIPFLDHDPGLEDSLFKFRFFELDKQLQWLYFSIMTGSYHQSIRELRYILESFLQAYYIDKNHSTASMNCKLEVLKEVELYGFNIISKNPDLKKKNKKELNSLYSHLSKHVHSSYEKLSPVIEKDEFEHNVTFKYNPRMLEECINILQRTMDAIFLLIFLYETDLSTKMRPTFINTLQKNGYNHTYELVKSQLE